MTELFSFLRWLITYAVEGHGWTAFIHFFAVLLIVSTITRITTVVSVSTTWRRRKKKKTK